MGSQDSTTGRVIWHTSMSVDGFIAGPDHRMEWGFDYDYGDDDTIDDVISTTGAILAGRNSFDVGNDDTQPTETDEAFGGRWKGPEFVLSHRPPPPGYDHPSVTFISEPIDDAVKRGIAAAEGRNLLVLGANVGGSALAAGLVDEVLLHIAPMMLGGGIRLYGDSVTDTVKLELIEARLMGQVATLRLAPIRI